MHIWTGVKRELCTPNTTVRCVYPPEATMATKATLLGSTLLLTLVARREAEQANDEQMRSGGGFSYQVGVV